MAEDFIISRENVKKEKIPKKTRIIVNVILSVVLAFSLLFDAAASEAGIQNVICLREIGALLEQLHYREFVSPAVSQAALDMLFLQQVDHKLNGKLCSAVPIAHKTGEDDQLSSDVGIVYAAQPFVICFAGHETDVYAWEDLMRQGSYDLCKALENDF